MATSGVNWLDAANVTNKYTSMYIKGFLDISGGNLVLRNNNFFVQGGDTSLNGNLYAGKKSILNGDVSMNSRLDVNGDVSFNSRLDVNSFTVNNLSSNSINLTGNITTSTGYVGVGTTNMTSPLHVVTANTYSSVDGTQGGLYLNNTNITSNASAVLGARTSGPTSGSPYISLDVNNVAGWSIGNDNTANNVLRFKPNNNFSGSSYFQVDRNANISTTGDASFNNRLFISGTGIITNNTNLALGYNAFQSNTTGIYNTGFGAGSLYYNTTGSFNTGLGYNTGPANGSGTFSNSTAIGVGAQYNASNQIVIGTSTETTVIPGNVSLNSKLSVGGGLVLTDLTSKPASTTDGSLVLKHNTPGGSSSIVFPSTANYQSDFGFIQFDDNRGAGGESNKLTIGTQNDGDDDLYLSPSGTTYVTSNLRCNGTIVCNSSINTLGYICRPGTGSATTGNTFNFFWTSPTLQAYVDTSQVGIACDYRIKQNITLITPVLNRLCSVEMYNFEYKDILFFENNGTFIGCTAHELQEVFNEYPKLVNNNKDDVKEDGTIKPQSIEASHLQMIMMKAIQELNEEMNTLKDELKSIKDFIKSSSTNQ